MRMSYLSVSTWSLHRNLGPLRWTEWDNQEKQHVTNIEEQAETTTLLELPAALAAKGFQAVEICHFHFPHSDADYLQQLRTALKEANITLHTLLLDYGDISSTDEDRTQADIQFIKEWIDIASTVGAKQIRIIAGDASPKDTSALERVSKHLNSLAQYAEERNVRVVTENFRSLASTAENCLHIVENSNQKVALIADFGNFTGSTKYEELAKILPYSTSVHAKPNYDGEGIPEEAEFRKCLDLLQAANYEGPINIIYDGPGDMWAGIERVKRIVEEYL